MITCIKCGKKSMAYYYGAELWEKDSICQEIAYYHCTMCGFMHHLPIQQKFVLFKKASLQINLRKEVWKAKKVLEKEKLRAS